VAVRIQSGWRDDGQATFDQHFAGKNALTLSSADSRISGLKIVQEADQVTSLGRCESHLALILEAVSLDKDVLSLASSPPTEEDQDTSSVDFRDGDALMTAVFSKTKADVSDTANNNINFSNHQLAVQVPEKVNLICQLDQGGSIEVDCKIEGDVQLSTTDGDIRVKKLRGHTIDLETHGANATIYASDLLEAENLKINLRGGRFRAKRIHGDTVDIRMNAADDSVQQSPAFATTKAELLDDDDEGSLIDISSMYVSGTGGAQVSLLGPAQPVKRGVRIKSHHGPALVNVSGVAIPSETHSTFNNDDGNHTSSLPLVELGSVNGSCEVSITDVHAPIKHDDWTACQVHYDSISPESVSLISTNCGNIGLTFDRKLEADLRLLSAAVNHHNIEDTAAMLADEEDPQQVKVALENMQIEEKSLSGEGTSSRISIETASFTESQSYSSPDNTLLYKEGWVENKSHEPDSRFEMKTRGVRSVGKINMEGAADQALKNFSSPLSSTEENRQVDSSIGAARPLIVAATTGNIKVETLSWLGAIARRYGIDERGRDLGRQASRRGRQIIPSDK